MEYANKDMYAHPGVAKSPDSKYRYEETDHVFHNYYQWVCFVLFLQAVACYLPWFCWKHKEGGFVWRLVAKVCPSFRTVRVLKTCRPFCVGADNFLLTHRCAYSL